MTGTSEPTSGVLHLARSGVLGCSALALALTGHVLAGGEAPAAVGLAVLAVLTCASVLVITLRRLGALALLAALGGLQVVLHAGLTLASASGTATVLDGGHHHGAHAALAVTAGHVHHAGWPMLLAHALATALTAALLARGEELLWLACSVLAPVVALAVAAASVLLRSLRTRPAPLPLDPPRLRPQRWVVAAPRRGPPALV